MLVKVDIWINMNEVDDIARIDLVTKENN